VGILKNEKVIGSLRFQDGSIKEYRKEIEEMRCNKCGAEVKEHANTVRRIKPAGNGRFANEKKAVMSGEKQWVKPVAIAAAVVLAIGAVWMLKGFYMSKRMGSHPMFPPHRDLSARLTTAVPVKEQGGDVRIPVKTVDDGKAHFFAYTAGNKTVTFFVMKALDGSFRTALDACGPVTRQARLPGRRLWSE
jgi:hypothetical protein